MSYSRFLVLRLFWLRFPEGQVAQNHLVVNYTEVEEDSLVRKSFDHHIGPVLVVHLDCMNHFVMEDIASVNNVRVGIVEEVYWHAVNFAAEVLPHQIPVVSDYFSWAAVPAMVVFVYRSDRYSEFDRSED